MGVSVIYNGSKCKLLSWASSSLLNKHLWPLSRGAVMSVRLREMDILDGKNFLGHLSAFPFQSRMGSRLMKCTKRKRPAKFPYTKCYPKGCRSGQQEHGLFCVPARVCGAVLWRMLPTSAMHMSKRSLESMLQWNQ